MRLKPSIKQLLIGKSYVPNKPEILARHNNCKFILRPVDHSKVKHYQKLAQGSSSALSLTTSLPTSSSRKHHANTDTLAEPLGSAFSKKSNNVLTSAGGMLSTSEESTTTAIDTKKNKRVHISFKGPRSRPPMTHIGQMLSHKINLGDTPKDAVKERAQNLCFSVIYSRV